MALRTLVEAINDALRCEMAADDRVILLGEDIGREGGVFRVTEGLQAVYGPQRVVDTPLAESGIAGMAIGMAIAGLRPVAEMQFMAFLYPAFDQITNHLGRMRNRSRGRFTCPLVMRAPYGGGIHPPEHHSESGEAILAHTPGIKVVIPATPYDAKGLLISAIRDPDPVIFLEPERMYRAVRQEVPDGLYTVPIGQARVVQEGTDVTVIGWGSMMREVNQAAELLRGEGVSVEIIDVRTIAPMDVPTLIDLGGKDRPRCGGARSAPHLWSGRRDCGSDQRKSPAGLCKRQSSASRVLTPSFLSPSSKNTTCRRLRVSLRLSVASWPFEVCMALEFRFPDVGEGIHEGEIVRWLVKEGDEVRPDQPLVEIETDKAVVEIPAPRAGTIVRVAVGEGEKIQVGEVLVVIGEAGERRSMRLRPRRYRQRQPRSRSSVRSIWRPPSYRPRLRWPR